MTGIDRVPVLLEDLRRLAASSDKIVRHGQQAFESVDGDLLRLAAKAVLLDLATFADRMPETFRAQHPAVPWRKVRALRNFLAHDYEGTDYGIVWGVIADDLPAIVGELLDAPLVE